MRTPQHYPPLKEKFITIKLGVIRPHAQYENYNELLTLTDYALTASNCFTPWAMSACLTIHPIIVVKPTNETDEHFCVGGIRSLLLAKSIQGVDESVQAILLDKPCDEEIALRISADVLLTHLLFSIKKPETLGRIFNKLPPDHLSCLLVESARSKSGFTEQTSYVYNTLFPQKAKP